MNYYTSHLIAQEHMADLLREAEQHRLARQARTSRSTAPERRLSLRRLVARFSPARASSAPVRDPGLAG